MEFTEDVAFFLFGYLDVVSIYKLLVADPHSFRCVLDRVKMFTFLTQRVSHRDVSSLTLPQLINVCRYSRSPGRIAIGASATVFLKQGKVYRENKSRNAVTEIIPEGVIEVCIFTSGVMAVGRNFFSYIEDNDVKTTLLPSLNIIQVAGTSGACWDCPSIFLLDDGSVYNVKAKKKVQGIPPVCYLSRATGSFGNYQPVLDVDGETWLLVGNECSVTKRDYITMKSMDEDVVMALTKHGIKYEGTEVYESNKEDAFYLVETSGRIRIVKRCGYPQSGYTEEEECQSFSF